MRVCTNCGAVEPEIKTVEEEDGELCDVCESCLGQAEDITNYAEDDPGIER